MIRISLALVFLLTFQWGISQTIDTLILVDGKKMHFHIVKGTGTPILFESGNGDDASIWSNLLTPIHDSLGTTLITYDRAGLGSSEIDTLTINIQSETDHLISALDQLGYPGELFLVCHSFGSYYTILLARNKPERIAGAVFIEPLLPAFFTKRMAKKTKKSIPENEWISLQMNAPGFYCVLREITEIEQLMTHNPFPPTIPATVICASNPPEGAKDREQKKWIAFQEKFGHEPNHTYVLAKNCDHKVWENDSQLVINEIVNLYRGVQSDF